MAGSIISLSVPLYDAKEKGVFDAIKICKTVQPRQTSRHMLSSALVLMLWMLLSKRAL
jgi:hypothetical protein